MKQVEVTILGQSYLLTCPEGGEARLAMAVSTVDREMSAIRDAGKIKARERIAVLAALNIAYQQVDRVSTEPVSPMAGRQPHEPTDGSGPSTAVSADEAPEWGALIRRLDDALAGDGRLV